MVQIGLMLAVGLLLTQWKSLVDGLYDCCSALSGWIPFLWRYGDYFIQSNRESEFKEIFAIYASFLVLEIVFVLITTIILWKHIDFRLPSPFGRTKPFAMVAMALCVILFFLLGDYSIARSSLARGYLFQLFVFAVALPGTNIWIALVLYGEYGKGASDLVRMRFGQSNNSGKIRRN
jgi:hypothetical protein